MQEHVRFRGGETSCLVGELLRPDTLVAAPVVVFAHARGSSKASPRDRAIADALVESGIAAFLFDFRGHGESERCAGAPTLEGQVADLEAAIDWVMRRRDLGAVAVAGSGSGAAVAIAVAARDARVRALVLRAPSEEIETEVAARIDAPALLVQGELDPLAERNHALSLALHCEHRLLTVPGAGRGFDEPGSFEHVRRATVSWLSRHLLGASASAGGVRDESEPEPEKGPRRFASRTAAGVALAQRLAFLRGSDVLVLALPNAGVPVAEPIARALAADLDVLVARKIRAPARPELAIGAVAEGGVVLWNRAIVRALGLSDAQCERQLALARHELHERTARYRAVGPRAAIAGRTLVLVDEGAATGATLEAAVRALREHRPGRVVVALPAAPAEALERVRGLEGVERVVALLVPAEFRAVGHPYEDFHAVSSADVCSALRCECRRRDARRAARVGSARVAGVATP